MRVAGCLILVNLVWGIELEVVFVVRLYHLLHLHITDTTIYIVVKIASMTA